MIYFQNRLMYSGRIGPLITIAVLLKVEKFSL